MSDSRRVLLLEDDADQAFLLKLQLEKAGCAVTVAVTANDALDLLCDEQWDGLVLDWMLGGTATGADVARASIARRTGTPSCIVTAGGQEGLPEELFGLDVPVLSKPATVEQLFDALGWQPASHVAV